LIFASPGHRGKQCFN